MSQKKERETGREGVKKKKRKGERKREYGVYPYNGIFF